MAELEDVTLDGRPLHSLRVADLKVALEERGLPKSGQKNALVKRLKGALMLENLQKTSHHMGLQPNSQIGEEMSQNSFIKQYLAKQQELLRQRLEREAREAAGNDGTDQEDHTEANNTTVCPPPDQDVAPSLDQHKPTASECDELRGKEMPLPSTPAQPGASLSVRAVAERQPTSSHGSADGDDDHDEEKLKVRIQRRPRAELPKSQPVRERAGGSQPPPRHVPLLSQQLRQPTPPPSPPPELSFPLPDTPKQSPPSPEPPPRQRMSSSSSSGSTSSDSRSSSPEPADDTAEHRPGPLTLLVRKMESDGAFSGAGRHETGRVVSAITHTANAASVLSYPSSVISNKGVSVVRTTGIEKRDSMKQNRERQKEHKRLQALEKESEDREKALKEERTQVLEQEEAPKREKEERERALQQESEEKEKALELERLEREQALEQERLEREAAVERERQEKKRAREKERLERERIEREQALERERLERERIEREQALERERLERERIEREQALERERLERERIEREQALERERLERERIEREQALERERLERERIEREQALERERRERERQEREQALERERRERERREREQALERERQEIEKAKEQERLEKQRALEREMTLEHKRQEKERQERKMALERERLEKEKALEQERLQREQALEAQKKAEEESERALEKEREKRTLNEEKQRALEEKERLLEQERVQEEKEKALKHEKEEEQEKKRKSHLPPWKRGCDFSYPVAHPETPEGQSGKPEESEELQSVTKNTPSGEPVPQQSPTISTPSPSKKSRILRDTPVTTSVASVLKRHRTFSDRPQAPLVLLATMPGEPEQENAAPALQTSLQTRVRISAPLELENKNPEMTTQKHARQEEEKMVTEANRGSQHKETSEDTKCETLRDEDEKKPSSHPPEKNRGRKSSSSSESSSSDSDSESSSSRPSSSLSSSTEKRCSALGDRKSREQQKDSSSLHTEKVSQSVAVIEKSPTAQRKKQVFIEQSKEEDVVHTKKPCLELRDERKAGERKQYIGEDEARQDTIRTEVKEAVMAEPERAVSESSGESTTPKTLSARKISLGSSKQSPGVVSSEWETENTSRANAGRKRRWGSSTAVTAKKPSISITTDSLKSLIPDIPPSLGQEAVVDLHPEEMHLSEDEGGERGEQELKIRRTVTQVVHSDTQENGQKSKKSEHEDERNDRRERLKQEEKTEDCVQMDAEPSSPGGDVDVKTVTPSDTLIRRSISQQKSGVIVTIDDPVGSAKQRSPHGKLSNIIHVCNLVRPFTLGQLKELLNRTGAVLEDAFWIDKIKSHCYVTYSSTEEALATRTALHGVRWPQSNPKFLSVDFCMQEELDFHRGLGPAGEKPPEETRGVAAGSGRPVPVSLIPEGDQWWDREREMERREREWDRDKIRDFSKPGAEREAGSRHSPSRDRERRRKERGKSKERKTDKKEKVPEEPPAKLLDDLFCKTKAVPCIYWLPLTEEQAAQRAAARVERMRERERRRKEMEEEEDKKREEERRERMKTSTSVGGESEKDRDRDRGRERQREGEKQREGYRRFGGNSGSGRSQSRSDPPPRDRRH